jgi:hypothetical protein
MFPRAIRPDDCERCIELKVKKEDVASVATITRAKVMQILTQALDLIKTDEDFKLHLYTAQPTTPPATVTSYTMDWSAALPRRLRSPIGITKGREARCCPRT